MEIRSFISNQTCVLWQAGAKKNINTIQNSFLEDIRGSGQHP